MKVIGLFSGIGGFELGFEREGFQVVSVCENDSYKQKVLKARFPRAKLNPDILSCSLEDFHAKTSPLPGVKSDSEGGTAGYGLSFSELSRRLNRTGLWSKMRAILGGDGCPACAPTSSAWAMPACHFECEPVTWEPPMPAPASSLLPTPTASSYGSCRGGGSGRVGKWRKSLDSLGYTNPEYREWMMGFPIGWSGVEPLETRARQSSRKSSRGGLKKS